MNICIITPCVIKGDGQGRANYEIVYESIRCGHQVTLLASRVDSILQKERNVTWIPISGGKWPTQFLKDLVFSQKSTAWLHENHSRFDVIQAYGAVTGYIADINTAQFVHSAWIKSPAHISKTRRDFYGFYQWLYTALNSSWEKRVFRQAKISVAVSERVKQELIDIGVPEKDIQVIWNGVDSDEFTPGNESRKRLNLPEQVPLAIFAGDIRINRKNLDTVLHALTQVPNLHLAVIGTLEGSPYPNLAKHLDLSERVHFLGFRRDIAQIMQTADFFVFPSRYEPFGMVVTEAMASGLPVITATTTGAAEVVTPECGIVLSDPEDTDGLAKALETLTNDSEKCLNMGKHAREIAKQHTWTNQAKQYVDLFDQLVCQKAN